MKSLQTVALALFFFLCTANVCVAGITDMALFKVIGKNMVIQYNARVMLPECSFDSKKPVEIYMIEESKARRINWLEAKYLAFDYFEKATQRIVAEVKYFRKNNLRWPLMLVAVKTPGGGCHAEALASEAGEAIQKVDIKQDSHDVPKELIVTATLGDEILQTPISLKNIQN